MSLPSQTKRTSAHRSSVFRAQNQSGSSSFAFLMALLIMLGIWVVTRSGSEPEVIAANAGLESKAQPQLDAGGASGEPARAVENAKTTQHAQTGAADWLDAVRLPGKPAAAPLAPAIKPPSPTPAPQSALLKQGFSQLNAGDVLSGRRSLTKALLAGGLPAEEAQRIRQALSKLGERWIFGAEILEGDPFSSTHKIAKGDLLSRLPKRRSLAIDWRFLQRINAISDPSRVRLGQKLKLVRGPFHAVVSKSEFRLDLYLGEPAERIFVKSFPIGHGEFNSTPEGLYQVRKDSKLINPAWTNPRTKQRVAADDPENPIGEHWIGLEGVSDAVRDVQQIGIHGTTDLPSIGQMKSMGCVRMHAADVALIYEVLVRPASSIDIRP